MDFAEIFLIGSSIFDIGLILIFFKVYNRMKDNPNLIRAIISGIFLMIFFFLASYFRFKENPYQSLFTNISLIPIDFFLLFLYLYFETLNSARIPEKRLLFFASLFLFNIIINILNIFNLFESKNFFPLFAALTYFYGSFSALFGLYVLYKTFKIYNAKPVKLDFLAVLILLFSLIIYQISGVQGYLGYNTAESLFLIATFFFFCAAAIILFNSILNNEYIFLIPNPIHLILVYTSGGVLLYNRNFYPQGSDMIKKDECMITGGVTGFSMFFKEILGSDAIIQYIDAKSFEFYFESLPNNAGSFVVVTTHANQIMLRSMKKLVNNIPSSYLDQIGENSGVMMQKEFDILIQKYFPYLQFTLNQNKQP